MRGVPNKGPVPVPRGMVGREVRRIRELRGMNAARLADQAGLSRSVLSLAERGKRTLREDTILRLAAALDVPPATLLGGGTSWRAGYEAGRAEATASARSNLPAGDASS